MIASLSIEEHKRHLHQLFAKLKEHGTIINPSKCVLGTKTSLFSEVTFLGYTVPSSDIKPLISKEQAIIDFPKPVNVQQLRRFF